MFPTHREIWKSIDGYKHYEVGWFGRVRNTKTARILKPGLSGCGYLTVSLCKNGKGKTHTMHQLVAREWVLNPDGKRCVDHIDGDKMNSHHENNRWSTPTENSRNALNTNKARSSIYKGVCMDNKANKWKASIRHNGN